MKKELAIISVLLLSACSPQRNDGGYEKTSANFDKVMVGTSTNKDVLELLGSPSSYSSFGDETWYYISQSKESLAFLEPTITNRSAVAVVFDKQGVVRSVNKFNQQDGQEVAVSTDKTPTEGNRITLWQQLLGNLGRFNGASGSLPGQHGTGGEGPPGR